MPYCPQCGTKIEVEWNACPNCGYNLKQEFDSLRVSERKIDQSYNPRLGSNQQQSNYPPIRTYSAGQNNIFGIIALIFGLLGLCCILGSFNFIFGVVAIVFGAIGMNRDENPQMSKIGLALGIIVLVCGIFLFVMMIPFFTYFMFPY